MAQHEKDAAAAAAAAFCDEPSVGDDTDDCEGECEALDALQTLNERKRESLHMSFNGTEDHAAADEDEDDVPCILEMQQRTNGLFRR